MIIGIGSDVIQIPRIEALLQQYGQRFIDRVYTKAEQEAAEKFAVNPKAQAAYYAKRFAAKEAFVKAIGTGFGKYVAMNQIAILNEVSGKPYIVCHADLSLLWNEKQIDNQVKPIHYHVSLSDDYPIASAWVICECGDNIHESKNQ